MSYEVTDGKCHNANRGTYGHECGKPATWTASKPSTVFGGTFTSMFCDRCKREGDEAREFSGWRRIGEA
jgi:hypothetical protein